MKLLMGLNVGGSFTNTAVYSEEGIKVAKVPSYKEDLPRILSESLQKLNVELDKVTSLIISFPLAMHPVLARNGAKAGLLCTEGFKDSLDIQEGRKPYVLRGQQDKIMSLIRRRHRREINERIDPDGNIMIPLDMSQVAKAVDELVNKGVESIAVCFIYSFVNNVHEVTVRDYIKKKYPQVDVCISSDVAPIIGEFRRMSTTAVDAYVSPKVKNSVNEINDYLAKKRLSSPLLFLQSSGGVTTSEAVKERVVQLMWSCPVGGVMGAINFFCKDYKDLITLDIGGTTTDVCLIKDGKPPMIMESKVDEYLLQFPIIDITSVPIGGNSIVWNDPFGALMVGPNSTGSEPGPACFDKGGEEATVTDALLLLGMYPLQFLGGQMKLNFNNAKKALGVLAKERKTSEEAVAESIYQLFTGKISHAISALMRKKGYDSRDFTLVAYGGAGPAHGLTVAQELDIKRVIIPPHPGAFCGLGLLTIDLVHELAQSYFTLLENADTKRISDTLAKLEKEAFNLLEKEGMKKEDITITKMADIRYMNQVTELSVALPPKERYDDLNLFSSSFHRMHQSIYGFSFEEDPVELTVLRVRGVGKLPTMTLQKIEKTKDDLKKAIKGERNVFFPLLGRKTTKVIDRKLLLGGHRISGPSVVEEDTSTTVIPSNIEAEVDDYGNIMITLK